MRDRYLVCYDISDSKRLRRVAQACEGYGLRLQYSVFECMLDNLGLQRLRSKLFGLIKHDEDQVMFVVLGPEHGTSEHRYESMGRPLPVHSRVVVV